MMAEWPDTSLGSGYEQNFEVDNSLYTPLASDASQSRVPKTVEAQGEPHAHELESLLRTYLANHSNNQSQPANITTQTTAHVMTDKDDQEIYCYRYSAFHVAIEFKTAGTPWYVKLLLEGGLLSLYQFNEIVEPFTRELKGSCFFAAPDNQVSEEMDLELVIGGKNKKDETNQPSSIPNPAPSDPVIRVMYSKHLVASRRIHLFSMRKISVLSMSLERNKHAPNHSTMYNIRPVEIPVVPKIKKRKVREQSSQAAAEPVQYVGSQEASYDPVSPMSEDLSQLSVTESDIVYDAWLQDVSMHEDDLHQDHQLIAQDDLRGKSYMIIQAIPAEYQGFIAELLRQATDEQLRNAYLGSMAGASRPKGGSDAAKERYTLKEMLVLDLLSVFKIQIDDEEPVDIREAIKSATIAPQGANLTLVATLSHLSKSISFIATLAQPGSSSGEPVELMTLPLDVTPGETARLSFPLFQTVDGKEAWLTVLTITIASSMFISGKNLTEKHRDEAIAPILSHLQLVVPLLVKAP